MGLDFEEVTARIEAPLARKSEPSAQAFDDDKIKRLFRAENERALWRQDGLKP